MLYGRLVEKGVLSSSAVAVGDVGDAVQVVYAEVVADVLVSGVEPVTFLILMQVGP